MTGEKYRIIKDDLVQWALSRGERMGRTPTGSATGTNISWEHQLSTDRLCLKVHRCRRYTSDRTGTAQQRELRSTGRMLV